MAGLSFVSFKLIDWTNITVQDDDEVAICFNSLLFDEVAHNMAAGTT